MNKHWQNLRHVLIHKWYVLIACLQIGGLRLLWRGLIHDWSKFLPSEFFAYSDYFYGVKIQAPNNAMIYGAGMREPIPHMIVPDDIQQAFDLAWNYHQKRNDHHWEYWLLSPMTLRNTFNLQSSDGGMSELIVANRQGKIAALVMHHSVQWLKVDYEMEQALLRDLKNTPIPLPMPHVCRMEMLADWIGAGKARGMPETWKWYASKKNEIWLHPDTRLWVEEQLALLKNRHDQTLTQVKNYSR